MWGPSEFYITGRLKDWDIRERLGEIHAPTLVVYGRDDEVTPQMAETIRKGIPAAEKLLIPRRSSDRHPALRADGRGDPLHAAAGSG